MFTRSPSSPLQPIADGDQPDIAFSPQRVTLGIVVLMLIGLFGLMGNNFLSIENLLTVFKQNVELGLLALALTPIILTGGIDLSVGSLLGLSAILFGKLWHDADLSPWLAGLITLVAATLAGGLNAVLITRGKMPPLIVTLGTFSLFRGIAEGWTRGQESVVGFPESFTFLGTGTILEIPTQLWLFVPAVVLFYLLVHHSAAGRALSAIGFSPEGARYAGLRTGRLSAGAYMLAGFCSGLAALIYVARFDQAKADAAVGFELRAITAVVLGGTSIFGGRASVLGTLLGLAAVAVLENGMGLAGYPREMTGVLVGVMLLSATGFDFFRSRRRSEPAAKPAPIGKAENLPVESEETVSEELDMRNSQLAVLCSVIVAAALIIAGSNAMLITSLHGNAGRTTEAVPGGGDGTGGGSNPARKLVIAVMPKSKGNSYFIACQKGAEEAAKELGVEMLWDGPTSAEPTEQNKIIETWITRKVDAIAVAVENAGGLSVALKKAQRAGIKVVTWDADANSDARSFFCNQATPDGIGDTMMETAAKEMNNEGKFVIISGSQTAANLNLWRDRIKLRAREFPKIECAEVVYCDDKPNVALDLAKQMLNKYPDLKLILANCSPAVPAGAEAVKQANRPEVKVIGLGLPNENKKYVKEGVTQAVVLWKTADLGYLAVQAAKATVDGKLKPGDAEFDAGRLGKLKLNGSSIILGKPFVFTKDNIDQFDF